MTVEVNKVEESPEIENDASKHNKSDEVMLKSQNDNPSTEIEINKEDVIQVKKSSSLRDFISLSLSVGAEVRIHYANNNAVCIKHSFLDLF